MAAGCQPLIVSQSAYSTAVRRYSVIERGLKIARLNGMSGEPDQIYVSHMPARELEAVLREQDIQAAARYLGRSVAQLQEYWEHSQQHVLPRPILERNAEVGSSTCAAALNSGPCRYQRSHDDRFMITYRLSSADGIRYSP